MNIWIALFPGINVGGHRKLPMRELVPVLENLGLSDVHTYIQSGNVVFRSMGKSPSALSSKIAGAVQSSHGFQPRVLVLSLDAFRDAVAATPFPATDAESKTVHLCFLTEPAPRPDLDAMDAVKTDSEEYVLSKEVLYLHTPDGLGKSRLAQKVERLLGVQATARNWRSVNKILEIAERI